MYSWQSICITYMIGLAPGNASERWKVFCPVSFLAKLLIRVVLTDGNGEKAAKLTWWSPVVVSFLGPVTILETTSSDGSAGAKESVHAFYHSKATVSVRVTTMVILWTEGRNPGRDAAKQMRRRRKQASKQAGDQACPCGTGGAGNGSVTRLAWLVMRTWMNEWMIKWWMCANW
jgi:hypothetical protein